MPTLLSQGGYTGFTEEELKGVQGGAADADALERKVDDDSFLHLGNLYADMRRLHCVSHLHYGSMGFTGYDPSIWRMCGWSWNTRGFNFK